MTEKIRNLTVGALCAVMIGGAAFAPAQTLIIGDRHAHVMFMSHHHHRHHVWYRGSWSWRSDAWIRHHHGWRYNR